MSIWPHILDRCTASGGPAILGAAALVYVAEVLFSVWTVAYNFVPGGVYTREHTDWLIGFVMVTIAGLLFLRKLFYGRRTVIHFLGVRILGLGLCGLWTST